MKKVLLKNAFLLLISISAKAQIFYNNGANVFSSYNSIIKVQGSATNQGSIEHNGNLIIDSTFTNRNNSFVKGNGIYNVYEHWINSGVYLRDTSTVNLKGSVQHIKGDSVTRYFNLNLLGLGVKEIYINSMVFNKLNLSVNELATLNDTMFLENENPNSLIGNFSFGSEAFISNLDSGSFSRKTNNVVSYYYPLGNKFGSEKFRPLRITPNLNSVNRYNASYFNSDPSASGFSTISLDSSLCVVNNKFYHHIGRSGTSSADIEIGYLVNQDNNFNTISNWKKTVSKWFNINQVTSNNFIGSYNSNKRLSWSNFSNINYSLANYKPLISSIIADTIICVNGQTTFIINTGNYTYDWNINNGTVINNIPVNTITIRWDSVGYFNYNVVITDLISGCKSNLLVKNINVVRNPIAGFSIDGNTPFLPNAPILLTDNSINANAWSYQLLGNSILTEQNPTISYDISGNYVITQIVTNSYGCSDTVSKTIFIEDVIIIPNTFTPNSDGVNDVFKFNCSGCTDFDIEILNRWGVKIYQGNKGSSFWDGTNGVGEKLSNGTYFYVIRIKHDSKISDYKGFIQLFN